MKILVCNGSKSIDILLEELVKQTDIQLERYEGCKYSPATAITDDKGVAKVVFYGELKLDAFLESVKIFQKGNYQVSDRILDFLDMIDKEVNIKVFTTQSCGWCFPAVIKAVSFAYLSEKIKVEVLDCYSFPELATSYNVITVPKTVINDRVEFVGSKDDNEFFGYIIKAVRE